jgi:hypothetical protein
MQCQHWTVLSVHCRSSYKSYRYAVLCTPCCFLSLCSAVHTLLFPIVMQCSTHPAVSYRYAVLYTPCCFLSLCSVVHTLLFPIVMQCCTHPAVSYRYAVLYTPCCFLSLRSTHSAILHLQSILFVGNTKFPKWIVLEIDIQFFNSNNDLSTDHHLFLS